MDFSDNLALPYLLPNQAQKHVTWNEALRALDALVQIRIESRGLQTPPAAPVTGARYLVPVGATGDWSGREGFLVAWQDGAWAEFAPGEGWLVWLADEAALLVYSDGEWVTAGIGGATTVGINTDADETNRLAVRSPSSLFDHEGAGHQLKLNKATVANTASLVFQSNYFGQAEIGLIGDNRLAVRTSLDGSAFNTVMVFDPATERLGLGTNAALSRLHLSQPSDARLTIETTIAGSGGGFDIINSADNQSWRVTGQHDLFKLRDHTSGLDKLVLYAGSDGDVVLRNFRNLGVGTATPSTRLHVDGPVRVGSSLVSALPSATAVGAGTLVHVSDLAGGSGLAFSDGSVWRKVSDGSSVS